MKVTLVGKKKVDFVNEKNEQVTGVALYYYGPDATVEGFIADKIWVGATNPLYGKALTLACEKPVTVDFRYEVTNGRGRASLVDIVSVG